MNRISYKKQFINVGRISVCMVLFCIQTRFLTASTTTDSLRTVLAQSIPDTVRVATLIELAGEYLDSEPDKSIGFCEEALAVSKSARFDEGIGEATGWLAYLYEQKGDIDRALEYYRQSLELSIKTGSRKSEAVIYSNMAAIYKDQGRIADAMEYNRKSLSIRMEIKDTAGISTTYNNLGLLFFNQGRIPEALEHYMKALKIETDLNNSEGITTAYNNLAGVYREQRDYEKALDYYRKSLEMQQADNDKYGMGYTLNGTGNLYEETGRPDSALHYYNRALAIRRELGDKQGIGWSLQNTGYVYYKSGKIQEAEKAFRESLTFFAETGDKRGMAIATNRLGRILLDTGRKAEAEKLFSASLKSAQELGFPSEIGGAAENLQLLYREQGRWRDALLMNDLFIAMRDSVQNDKNRKAVIRTQFQYEYDKKEALLRSEQERKVALADAEAEKQKLVRNGFMSGFALLLLFSLVVTRQRNRVKREKRRSDELLLNILPEETAEELKSIGSTTAREHEQVTVMFTDFKNFTSVSERLPAQELVSMIHRYYTAFDEIIAKNGLEKIKTIGDSYMCAGGLHDPVEGSAERTVRAALEIRDYVDREKIRLMESAAPYFEIRIGCHTGPVVAGVVGTRKFAYDIWGDTVNMASRMESSGEAGRVNISYDTYELVKSAFACIGRGKLEAKNKGMTEMYFADWPDSVVS